MIDLSSCHRYVESGELIMYSLWSGIRVLLVIKDRMPVLDEDKLVSILGNNYNIDNVKEYMEQHGLAGCIDDTNKVLIPMNIGKYASRDSHKVTIYINKFLNMYHPTCKITSNTMESVDIDITEDKHRFVEFDSYDLLKKSILSLI